MSTPSEELDLGGLTDEQIQTMSPDEIDKYLEAALHETDDELFDKCIIFNNYA